MGAPAPAVYEFGSFLPGTDGTLRRDLYTGKQFRQPGRGIRENGAGAAP